jgi:hypothetical protein
MSHSSKTPASVAAAGVAIWAIAAASGLLNAWGWGTSAAGLVAIVLVTLVLASEVLGITLALAIETAVSRKAWARVTVAGVLLIGVSLFNAFSGHRALTMIEAERAAPYIAAQAAISEAQAEVVRIEAAIAAVPTLPANVPAARLRAYQEARNAELARLEPQRAAAQQRLTTLPVVEAPPPSTPPLAFKLIVVLIELLKVAGLWAVTGKPSHPPAQQSAPSAASALAAARWAKAKAR